MMTDIIVYLSLGMTTVFVIAWAVRPDFREWIERPKHTFLESVRRYDKR
jgi:hypothetical protein